MSKRSLLITATALAGMFAGSPLETTGPVSPINPVEQDKEGKAAKPDPESAKTCGMCHTEIYAEWKGRKHSHAWDDKIYQDKLKTRKRPKSCYSCHIPERVLARVGRKPKTRVNKNLLHEGVTCVACHEYGGAIHGPFGAKTDAHRSIKDPLFKHHGSSALCMSCHNTKIDVVLPVGRDFKASGLEQKGESCAGCHMPEITRHVAVSVVTGKPVGEKRVGRSHKLLGPDDPEFCATAFELRVKKTDGKVVLHVENKTGHRIPGLRIRGFHFFVRQQDGQGKTLAEKKFVIDSENELKVLETRQFPYDPAAGAKKLEVTVEHYFMDRLVAQVIKKTIDL